MITCIRAMLVAKSKSSHSLICPKCITKWTAAAVAGCGGGMPSFAEKQRLAAEALGGSWTPVSDAHLERGPQPPQSGYSSPCFLQRPDIMGRKVAICMV